MKIDRLETHDRLEQFLSNDFDMGACAQHLIEQKPFGNHPFYIFCHVRTADDGSSKRFVWSPWIWKPRAQTNTILLKAYPGTDVLKVIWILPVREMWDSYRLGTIFENKMILECINQFDLDKSALEAPEPDDPSAVKAQEIAFEYQPQLFKRDSLPEHLKCVWDRKIAEKNKKKDRYEDACR